MVSEAAICERAVREFMEGNGIEGRQANANVMLPSTLVCKCRKLYELSLMHRFESIMEAFSPDKPVN